MAYPQQDKIRGMIELLYQELEKAYEHGNSALEAHYFASEENVGVDIVAYRGRQATNAADALGVRGGEALNLQRVALLLTHSRRRYKLLTETISFANPSALL